MNGRLSLASIRSRMLVLLFLAVSAGSGPVALAQPAKDKERPAKPDQRLALLVGVSKYANLPGKDLEGPVRDVQLMRDLLTDRFGFADAGIVALVATNEPDSQPTRANILSALDNLATNASKGDRVVVLLSGHGSRAPRLATPEDRNPAALTGLFLPQDTKNWNERIGKVENAIEDWEVSRKLFAILDKGAKVWLITDACHSGGYIRDKIRGRPAAQEVSRDVSAEQLKIPLTLMGAATRPAVAAAPDNTDSGFRPAVEHQNLAATYACRSHEETPERLFPHGVPAPTEGPYGLFTYTLVSILRKADKPMTYQELVRRVNGQYSDWERSRPFAIAEGKGRDQLVLVDGAGRRNPIELRKGDRGLSVNAGQLHGISKGSILAVYPPPGVQADDKLVGHVRVTDAQVAEAAVEPVEYAGIAAPAEAELRTASVAKPVFIDFGIDPTRVFIGPDPQNADYVKAWESISPAGRAALANEQAAYLESLQSHETVTDGRLIEIVTDSGLAEWLIVPWPGRANQPRIQSVQTPAVFFNASAQRPAIEWAAESLRKIARGEAMLKVAGKLISQGAGEELKVDLTLKRYTKVRGGDPVQSVSDAGGFNLYDGDLIEYEIANNSEEVVDVSLLFIGSDYGVDMLYPTVGEGENRLKPGEVRKTARLRVNNTTLGNESVVLIAMPAQSPIPPDFGFLADNGIEGARARSKAAAARNGSLTDLLLYSQFREGSRGQAPADADDTVFRIMQWETQKGSRPTAAGVVPDAK